MLKQRIITAVILSAIIIASLLFLPFNGFVLLLAAVWFLAAWEWADLSSFSGVNRFVYAGVTTALLAFTYWLCGIGQNVDYQALSHLMIVAGIWWLVALVLVVQYPKSAAMWGNQWVRALMGWMVLIPSAVALAYLLSQENGKALFIYSVLIVVTADVGAYFAGRKFGKKKLIPQVSPGKSWAGFYGGMAACLALALLGAQLAVGAQLAWWQLIVATLIAGLFSVLGDLLESMVKRHRGIKDSSQLLPGHGGFMDRIDSITAAAPIFTLLLLLFKAV